MVRDETFYARLDADDVSLLRRVERNAPNYSGRPSNLLYFETEKLNGRSAAGLRGVN